MVARDSTRCTAATYPLFYLLPLTPAGTAERQLASLRSPALALALALASRVLALASRVPAFGGGIGRFNKQVSIRGNP